MKMTKILALALALVLVAGLAACGAPAATPAPVATSAPTAEPAATPAPVEPAPKADIIAMITDVGEIDDKSFNQGTWEGIVAYCDANNIEKFYLKPLEQSDNEYLNTIGQAIDKGATVVITPGFLFEVAIYEAQKKYPDVKFMLIDGTPHDADYVNFETASNTVSVIYAEEQAGFLAGYAAVKDGATKLGFMGGMAVPAVMRYGYGFVQGADYAADELGVSIDMNYHYTNSFAPSPEALNTAKSWFTTGTEVIFACGGGMGNSVMAAAEETGKKVIGVDVDQGAESPAVVNSSMKGLASSVALVLDQYFDGNFPGGENMVVDASQGGVSLSTENNRFENFTNADYEALFGAMAAGEFDIVKDTNAAGDDVDPTDLPVVATTLKVVE